MDVVQIEKTKDGGHTVGNHRTDLRGKPERVFTGFHRCMSLRKEAKIWTSRESKVLWTQGVWFHFCHQAVNVTTMITN